MIKETVEFYYCRFLFVFTNMSFQKVLRKCTALVIFRVVILCSMYLLNSRYDKVVKTIIFHFLIN